jgi:hypothetical protein
MSQMGCYGDFLQRGRAAFRRGARAAFRGAEEIGTGPPKGSKQTEQGHGGPERMDLSRRTVADAGGARNGWGAARKAETVEHFPGRFGWVYR